MKQFIFLTSVICLFTLIPTLHSEDEYVADEEGYDEMDAEFYDSEEEDTPLAEMDPIYQVEEE